MFEKTKEQEQEEEENVWMTRLFDIATTKTSNIGYFRITDLSEKNEFD
jgi:hypothetical protein